ncbi:putative receptor-like protein kinase [Tanacetum coccineum]
MVAIKRFNHQMQTKVKFLIDILMLSDFKHENVIAIQGFHYDENEKIVIYEHAFHGSLNTYLSNTRNKISLTWNQRLKICLGAAQGLCFIHTCGLLDEVVHGDVKSANILLTRNFEAKISNFESKWAQKNVTKFLMASGARTLGYSDPAYTKTGVLTKAFDVYSFGTVLFEVLGKRLVLENDCYYGEQVEETKKRNKVEDCNNVKEIDSQTFTIVSAVTRHCMQERLEDRPTMGHVVQELNKALDILTRQQSRLIEIKDC